MADDALRRTMLFDFYGDLLTAKQREYYDLHYNNDLSLYEIAEQSGVSRQAVWDIIRRAEASMTDAEAKIGFIKRTLRYRQAAANIRLAAQTLERTGGQEQKALAERILGELDKLED